MAEQVMAKAELGGSIQAGNIARRNPAARPARGVT